MSVLVMWASLVARSCGTLPADDRESGGGRASPLRWDEEPDGAQLRRASPIVMRRLALSRGMALQRHLSYGRRPAPVERTDERPGTARVQRELTPVLSGSPPVGVNSGGAAVQARRIPGGRRAGKPVRIYTYWSRLRQGRPGSADMRRHRACRQAARHDADHVRSTRPSPGSPTGQSYGTWCDSSQRVANPPRPPRGRILLRDGVDPGPARRAPIKLSEGRA